MRLVGDLITASGLDVPLVQGVVSVGSERGNTIVVSGDGVAPRHARLCHRGGDWVVEDASGDPGTYLNGIRVTAPQLLRPGDYLSVGAVGLRVVAEPRDVPVRVAVAPINRVAWLVASGATFVTLAALVVVIARSGGGFEPSVPVAVTSATAAPAAVPRTGGPSPSPTAEAPPTAPPTSQATASEAWLTTATPGGAVTTAATTRPTGATPDFARATLRSALVDAPIESVRAAETALAGMRSVERAAAISTLAASQPEAVSGWLDLVLGTPTSIPLTGHLLFARYDSGADRYDVVRYDILSGESTTLLPGGSQPAMSPDGDSMTYRSWQPDGLGIYGATADGRQRWLLTREVHPEDGAPDWSPDGLTVAFTSMRYGDGRSRIYVMPAVGGDANGICIGDYVAWSPDGLTLAFKGCIGGSCGIMIGAPDCGGQGLLTTDASDGAPAWSPDGTGIAIQSSREGSWDIFLVRIDGTEVRRLTEAATIETMPAWSPDGLWIAFRSNADGEWGIWAVPVGGGEPRKLVPANVRPGDEIVEGFDWLP